ncbi:hypothetical protein [Bradyrhizobium sp. S3.5.5]|uniref:hypothetical protein n=1 Tax=unclassified Bradyrhizobium TaxID=2631580 RepID=UPI0033937B37
MVDAYKIERDITIFPRIVVSDRILKRLEGIPESERDFLPRIPSPSTSPLRKTVAAFAKSGNGSSGTLKKRRPLEQARLAAHALTALSGGFKSITPPNLFKSFPSFPIRYHA